MDINPPKGLLAQDECLDKQIKPLESLGEKSLEKQLEKNLLEIELFWEECLVKKINPQVSQNKTPSSTLDTLDVSNVKDKEKIQLNILVGWMQIYNFPKLGLKAIAIMQTMDYL